LIKTCFTQADRVGEVGQAGPAIAIATEYVAEFLDDFLTAVAARSHVSM
jgi:hypothetical protein